MTKKIVPVLEKTGVDIIELGIPFSDPLADGPTIQAASHRALQKGITLRKIFSAVGNLRKSIAIPVIFMTYYNPVLRYGIENFIRDCKRNGVDGVIIPDLPYEEAKDLVRLAKKTGIATIFLAAPTSTPKRIRDIVKNSTPFIYYVSLTGVTGARKNLPPEVISKVRFIKSLTKKPVAVGFGISGPSQAYDIVKVADGVIVGSAIVKVIANNQNNKRALLRKVYNFSKSLAKAIHSA
jgi:tryptophan synthase alpha chain